ncbi:hypothetical protein NKR23_g5220 [Pleurostoma richardsiae]|uniref:FAD-binding PCMH-type domain-containing protein n=1 Tax=Pleurostoma richardsiae TaxID=41990 RepID=A0AA38VR49_9PEZI|nr:hypothetical protein NKR23_g5220 [Pleurostoma richardsiae]
MYGLGTFSQCLLAAMQGNSTLVAFPSQQNYTDAVEPYNLDIPVVPAAVVLPTTAAQVAAAVSCAVRAGVKVQPRSGGHNYGNYGSSTGELSIHLDNLKAFSLDASTFQATVGAGMLLEELNGDLYSSGRRSIPHGISLNIGIGGHATVGGVGATTRMSGYTLDHIVEVEVVLANSSIVRASETQHPDLFFAIRGAAASFGIVTEFVFRTDPAPPSTVSYFLGWTAANSSTRAKIFKAWQGWVYQGDAPWQMSSTLSVNPGYISVSGAYFGTQAELDALDLESLFSTAPPDSVSSEVYTDYNVASVAWYEQIIQSGLAYPAYFYAKCIAFEADTEVPGDVADNFFDYLETTTNGTQLWAVNFELLGGAIGNTASNATAMPHRDMTFVMLTYGQTSGRVSDTTFEFLDGMNTVITSGHPASYYPQYAGYVDPRENSDSARVGYWGSNLDRLKDIKASVDPHDVFHNQQSVPVA